MTPTLALSFCSPRLDRIRLNLFLLALAFLFLPITAPAQVSFTGPQRSVKIGSQALGSASATVSLPFTIGANTTVGSIAVLTTGNAGKDFVQATGSTCTATTYATATDCVVNVTFKPLASGLRRGAAVFRSGARSTSPVLATVPVFGVGAGPQLVFGPGGAQTNVGSALSSPEGVAVDAAGNLYITDIDLQEVFKVTPGGTQTTVGTGLEVPAGVAVDGAGNVYITDSQAIAVFKVTPGGVQTTIGSGWDWPSGVAVDGAGNVYVSDPFIDAVYKVSPGGKQTTVGSGYNTPAGLAVDAAGNVYVADSYAAAVFKITPGGVQTTVGSGLVTPAAVAVDAAGNVYITDDGTNALYEVMPDGEQTTVSSGLDVPNGVAIDGPGNLYVANAFHSQVMKVNRAVAPSLSFAPTKVNSTSKDSPKTVQVENIGNAALKFSALTYATDFPEGAYNDDCTSSTVLAAASFCALTIDFSPVTSLGSKTSAVLKEFIKLTTNNLNALNAVEKVTVTGTEKQP
jgi:sugar lactone lactonase YvrE